MNLLGNIGSNCSVRKPHYQIKLALHTTSIIWTKDHTNIFKDLQKYNSAVIYDFTVAYHLSFLACSLQGNLVQMPLPALQGCA